MPNLIFFVLNKRVSIIIPVYNGKRYVSQTLESIAAQIYQPLKVIVVNNGSQDTTLQCIESFRTPLDNLVVLHQPNQDLVAARNLGFAHGSTNEQKV